MAPSSRIKRRRVDLSCFIDTTVNPEASDTELAETRVRSRVAPATSDSTMVDATQGEVPSVSETPQELDTIGHELEPALGLGPLTLATKEDLWTSTKLLSNVVCVRVYGPVAAALGSLWSEFGKRLISTAPQTFFLRDEAPGSIECTSRPPPTMVSSCGNSMCIADVHICFVHLFFAEDQVNPRLIKTLVPVVHQVSSRKRPHCEVQPDIEDLPDELVITRKRRATHTRTAFFAAVGEMFIRGLHEHGFQMRTIFHEMTDAIMEQFSVRMDETPEEMVMRIVFTEGFIVEPTKIQLWRDSQVIETVKPLVGLTAFHDSQQLAIPDFHTPLPLPEPQTLWFSATGHHELEEQELNCAIFDVSNGDCLPMAESLPAESK